MKMKLFWVCLSFLVLLGAGCPINLPPIPPEPPCSPVPDSPAKIVWKNNDQLELTWEDMPVVVGGGNEACVLSRRLTTPNFHITRKVKQVSSFHGFDNGDAVESLTILYAKSGYQLYARSEHLESASPDCYDAYDPPESKNYSTDGLILDVVCRATEPSNVKCHLIVMVEFESGSPPPPSGPCTLGTPHATQVPRAEFEIKQSGGTPTNVKLSTTPRAKFGKDYYCGKDMNWPEACAEGRTFGPVAPDGHPQRAACEAVFIGAPCPTWYGNCTGTGGQCPITFHTLVGNDPHPQNLHCPGMDEPPYPDHEERPKVFWARPEGKGFVYVCDETMTVCSMYPKEVDQ